MPSSANSVSDLERAEHKGFSAGVGAKRVIPFLDNGDGTYSDQPNQDYDETSIDATDPNSIVISYYRDSVLIATETITKAGSIITITKT